MSFVIVAALVVTVVAVVGIPLILGLGKSIGPQTFSVIKVALLWIAGVLSGLMMLMILAAAAWGMDTRIPWGLGIYMYLLPALSLPAFFLLKFSVRTLSIVMWLLTVGNAFAWFFGDRADRIASGMRPPSDPNEILGMFFNAFTLLYLMISILVQMASCARARAAATWNPQRGSCERYSPPTPILACRGRTSVKLTSRPQSHIDMLEKPSRSEDSVL